MMGASVDGDGDATWAAALTGRDLVSDSLRTAPGPPVSFVGLDWVTGLRRLALEVECAQAEGDRLSVIVVQIGVRSRLGRIEGADEHHQQLAIGVVRIHLTARGVLARLREGQLMCVLPGADRTLAADILGRAGDDFDQCVFGGVLLGGTAVMRRGEDSAQLLGRARADLAEVTAQER